MSIDEFEYRLRSKLQSELDALNISHAYTNNRRWKDLLDEKDLPALNKVTRTENDTYSIALVTDVCGLEKLAYSCNLKLFISEKVQYAHIAGHIRDRKWCIIHVAKDTLDEH